MGKALCNRCTMNDSSTPLMETQVMKYSLKLKEKFGCLCIKCAAPYNQEVLEEVYIGWWPEEGKLYAPTPTQS